jgi:hypothetical protein
MKTDALIDTMRQVEAVSASLNSTSWVWGGLMVDIYTGQILREHHDLDYLTLHLHEMLEPLAAQFQNAGWSAHPLSNGDLKLEKDGVKVHLGHLFIEREVRWTHNGELGALYFPVEWLVPATRKFCDVEVHVVAPQLQYVLLDHPELLNPAWELREKDRIAKDYFTTWLSDNRIAVEHLRSQIHD